MSGTWRAVLVVLGAVVLVDMGLGAVRSITGSPGGPSSSSYATGADATAAYAELLTRAGYEVARVRTTPSRAALDPRSTAVLLDPVSVATADADALATFVRAGGRLVFGGKPGRWLNRLVASPPRWSPILVVGAHVLAPAPETVGLARVETRGGGSEGRGTLPLLGNAEAALLDAAAVGRGRILLLADSSPLQNRLLGSADNAALRARARRRRAAGPSPSSRATTATAPASGLRPRSRSRGWLLVRARPRRARLIVARGRRFGPPEEEAAELPPPRREYVDSLAGVVARGQATATRLLEPVAREAACSRRRAGLRARRGRRRRRRSRAASALPDDGRRRAAAAGPHAATDRGRRARACAAAESDRSRD